MWGELKGSSIFKKCTFRFFFFFFPTFFLHGFVKSRFFPEVLFFLLCILRFSCKDYLK